MHTKLYGWFCMIACCLSCESYLDVKPDKQLAIPGEKLENLQLLLDNTNLLNDRYPSAGELASDNLYIPANNWEALPLVTDRNLYIWARDVFNDNDRNDWTMTYEAVFYANLVLESLNGLDISEEVQSEWNNVFGSALFFRAHAFWRLMQVFAKPYDPSTAKSDLGIALRLNANINEVSQRTSVEQCYKQIISDTQKAAWLLPETPKYKTRPSKPAAYALLARTFLSMREYRKALLYADSALYLYNRLLDYSKLDTAARYSFEQYNEEVIFHCDIAYRTSLSYPRGMIDTMLYDSYADNDLRKSLFFTAYGPREVQFKGSYSGSPRFFGGIATDELYLTRAECHARNGNVPAAMNDLNELMSQRFASGKFVPYNASGQQEALKLVLAERRRELVFRGLRWTDLRRLNKDSGFEKTLIRKLEGKIYKLPPNDNRYVLPIPDKVIRMSGMRQNE